MDCKRCAEDMTAFLDGELSNADSEQVRSHLQICASCTDELRSLEEAGNFIESHNRNLEPRPESWNMVRARIYRDNPGTRAPFWGLNRWRLALAALGLLAALAAGYIQYAQMQQKNLDRYISEYVREREAGGIITPTDNPSSYNPFLEVNATISGNPFRSEDR